MIANDLTLGTRITHLGPLIRCLWEDRGAFPRLCFKMAQLGNVEVLQDRIRPIVSRRTLDLLNYGILNSFIIKHDEGFTDATTLDTVAACKL